MTFVNNHIDSSSVKLCTQLNSLKTTKKISGHVDMFNKPLEPGDIVFYMDKFGVVQELGRMSALMSFGAYTEWVNTCRVFKVTESIRDAILRTR